MTVKKNIRFFDVMNDEILLSVSNLGISTKITSGAPYNLCFSIIISEMKAF
jgi:hypothetical protein